MTTARSRFGWQVACAASLTLAVAWMLAPTHAVGIGVDPALVPEGLTAYHSWADPFLFGNGVFTALPALLCAVVAAVGAWLALLARRTRRVPAWWGLAGAVLVVASALVAGFGWGHGVALVLLAAGAATGLIAARRALPPLVSGPAAR